MAERCVLSVTRPGDLVLDPFAGSGTTGLIAVEHGRDFLGFELSQAFAKEARRRVA
jgi:site-specific DNA-methyltransferase (adenine-specific)